MLGNIGPLEIGIVLLVALLVFGPKRLPELGNSLGRSIREFRSTVSGVKNDESVKALNVSAASPAPEASAEAEPAATKRA